MKNVRIRETGELISLWEFHKRLRGSNVSVPANANMMPADIIINHGADPIFDGPQPIAAAWQQVEGDGIEQDDDGNWRTKFKLVPSFAIQADEDAYVASWTAEQLKAQTPEKISDRQFFTALWKDGERISYEEALAAVMTGTIPAQMVDFIDTLALFDPDGAKDATLLLSGATEFRRDNYIVPVFGSMYGMTDDQIDALWRLGATL